MNSEEIKNIMYVLSTLVAVFGAPFLILKYFYDIRAVRRNLPRDEFKFADEFLRKVANEKDMHPYAKEKGYQIIAGTTLLSGNEIAHLLSLYTTEYQRENVMDQRPDMAIRDYVNGKRYLKFSDGGGVSQINI